MCTSPGPKPSSPPTTRSFQPPLFVLSTCVAFTALFPGGHYTPPPWPPFHNTAASWPIPTPPLFRLFFRFLLFLKSAVPHLFGLDHRVQIFFRPCGPPQICLPSPRWRDRQNGPLRSFLATQLRSVFFFVRHPQN